MRTGLIILSLFFLLSCHTRKKLVTTQPKVTFTSIPHSQDSLLRQPWEYLSCRLAVDYIGEEEQSLSVSMRMRRDSIIWFSVSANAGIQIQVMKGIITRDSIKAIEMIHKKYYRFGIAELGNRFGASLGLRELQNLFIGNPVFDTLVYKTDSVSKAWIAWNPPVANQVFAGNFVRPDSTLLIQKGSPRTLHTAYSGQFEAGNLVLSQFMNLLAEGASNTVRLNFEFKTASDAFIPSYPFTVPDGYDEADKE